MAGISNVAIEEFIEEENDDFQRNFVGFTILNTDRSNLSGTHWWSKHIPKRSNCLYLIL